MAKIRPATKDDMFDLQMLGKAFSDEAPETHTWNPVKVEEFFLNTLEDKDHIILVIDVDGDIRGFLWGIITEMWMSGTRVATELAWFVSKEHRGKKGSLILVKAFEMWAKNKGVGHVVMADIEDVSSLGTLYQRLGYKRAETAYMKEV